LPRLALESVKAQVVACIRLSALWRSPPCSQLGTTGPNQARLEEFHRWVGPLQNGIARVVAENLVAMRDAAREHFPADCRRRRLLVVIEMQRFDSTLGEAAQLDTSWTATGTKDGKMQMGRTTMREPVAAPDFEGLDGVHSRALARLSQDVADGVRSLDRSAS